MDELFGRSRAYKVFTCKTLQLDYLPLECPDIILLLVHLHNVFIYMSCRLMVRQTDRQIPICPVTFIYNETFFVILNVTDKYSYPFYTDLRYSTKESIHMYEKNQLLSAIKMTAVAFQCL